jgi:hypothetical protein
MSQVVRNPTDPTYLARQDMNLGALAAGSGGITSKFVAFAACQLFSLTTFLATLGTSTYTANGTATASGQQVSVITVINTSTTTTSVALATTTYGPFLAGGQGLSTAAIGGANQFALNTNTGTAQFGGISLPQGGLAYCVSGTDATAVTVCTLDYQVQQGAPIVL